MFTGGALVPELSPSFSGWIFSVIGLSVDFIFGKSGISYTDGSWLFFLLDFLLSIDCSSPKV